MRKAPITPESPLRLDSGGVIRIGDSRVTLESVFGAFERGASAEEIVSRFPSLGLSDVYRSLAFCLEHLPEVESYVRSQSKIASDLKRKVRASETSLTWKRLQSLRRGVA